jgi:hypothetical protein
MTSEVIGFEGAWEEEDVVVCAAAAVKEDDKIFNSVTLCLAPATSTLESLFRLKRPIVLQSGTPTTGLYIVAVRTTHKLGSHFQLDPGRLGGLVATKKIEGIQYYVFSDMTAVDNYREQVCEAVSHFVLNRPTPGDDTSVELLDSCIALRVHLTTHNVDFVRRLAESSVPNDRKTEFEELSQALQANECMGKCKA